MEAILQFKDYHVIETIYKFNPLSTSTDDSIYPKFAFSLNIVDEETKKEAWVGLSIELGDELLANTTFFVKAKIIGLFVITSEDDLPESTIMEFYKINAVSILYPYIRSLISDLTSKGTEAPVIIPAMNIITMMEEYERQQQSN